MVDILGLEEKCVSASNVHIGGLWAHKIEGIPEANFLEFELPCPAQECHRATSIRLNVKQGGPVENLFTQRDTFLRILPPTPVTPCGKPGIVRFEMETRAIFIGYRHAAYYVEVCYECEKCK